jgi:Spy/CpxP family protein refolding chaperone
VVGEIKQAQGRMVDVQWELQRAVERMVDLLKPDKVDEQAVLAQLDKVLAAEREVKRTQLGLMMRLKNILTPEQQRQLRELRAKQR